MGYPDVGDQGIRQIDQLSQPAGAIKPGKAAVDPDPESVGLTAGVVFLADPWVIDVTQLVIAVEVDQQ